MWPAGSVNKMGYEDILAWSEQRAARLDELE